MADSRKRFLSVAEFAATFGAKESCIRRWLLERKITHIKFGRLTRIPSEELDRLIAEGMRPRREVKHE